MLLPRAQAMVEAVSVAPAATEVVATAAAVAMEVVVMETPVAPVLSLLGGKHLDTIEKCAPNKGVERC